MEFFLPTPPPFPSVFWDSGVGIIASRTYWVDSWMWNVYWPGALEKKQGTIQFNIHQGPKEDISALVVDSQVDLWVTV